MQPRKRVPITLGDVGNTVTIVTGLVSVLLFWQANPLLSVGAVLATGLALVAINRSRRHEPAGTATPTVPSPETPEPPTDPLDRVQRTFEAIEWTEIEMTRLFTAWAEGAKVLNAHPTSRWRQVFDRSGAAREYLEAHKQLMEQTDAAVASHRQTFRRLLEEADQALNELSDDAYSPSPQFEARHESIVENSSEWFEGAPTMLGALEELLELFGDPHLEYMKTNIAGCEHLLVESGYIERVSNHTYELAKLGKLIESAGKLWTRYLAVIEAKKAGGLLANRAAAGRASPAATSPKPQAKPAKTKKRR